MKQLKYVFQNYGMNFSKSLCLNYFLRICAGIWGVVYKLSFMCIKIALILGKSYPHLLSGGLGSYN